MIRTLLHELKSGNEDIAPSFAALETLWSKSFSDIDRLSIDDLAKRLSTLQHDA